MGSKRARDSDIVRILRIVLMISNLLEVSLFFTLSQFTFSFSFLKFCGLTTVGLIRRAKINSGTDRSDRVLLGSLGRLESDMEFIYHLFYIFR